MKRGFGWKKQLHDKRDWPAWGLLRPEAPLPKFVDPTSGGLQPPPYDQGPTNSCVGHAVARHLQYDLRLQGLDDWFPSPLWIYSWAREMEGSLNEDSGCFIRDGIKSIVKHGAAYNDDWPLTKDRLFTRPPENKGVNLTANYSPVVQNLTSLRYILASRKLFIFGFLVYPAFESDEVAATGIVPMPKPGESEIGGHAVCATGYDDKKGVFIVPNSYGYKDWGLPKLRGFFQIPYEYVCDKKLCSDFSTINSVKVS